MLLPLFGLLLVPLIAGGLAILVAVADRRGSPRRTPYVGFTILFAGGFAVCFSLLLAPLSGFAFGTDEGSGLGFIVGYLLGLPAGAAFGLRLAARRRKQALSGR